MQDDPEGPQGVTWPPVLPVSSAVPPTWEPSVCRRPVVPGWRCPEEDGHPGYCPAVPTLTTRLILWATRPLHRRADP